MQTSIREDKLIKFDVSDITSNLAKGEMKLYNANLVEDSVGNPGVPGLLCATNLRIIWYSLNNKQFNVSIGYSNIISLTIKTIAAGSTEHIQSLHVFAADSNNKRLEFIFKDASEKMINFSNILLIYDSYQKTYLYRDIKFRGAIIQSGELIVLPEETIISVYNGVWNLSSDQGNLGSFILTNIRLVWFATDNSSFNISLPYIQISRVHLKASKYGPALVVQTIERGYVLGFRIDPSKRLDQIFKELSYIFSIAAEAPNLGFYYKPTDWEEKQVALNPIEEFQEIDKNQETAVNRVFNAYVSYSKSECTTKKPVYCKELGFAMENIRMGYKISDLWNITSNDGNGLS